MCKMHTSICMYIQKMQNRVYANRKQMLREVPKKVTLQSRCSPHYQHLPQTMQFFFAKWSMMALPSISSSPQSNNKHLEGYKLGYPWAQLLGRPWCLHPIGYIIVKTISLHLLSWQGRVGECIRSHWSQLCSLVLLFSCYATQGKSYKCYITHEKFISFSTWRSRQSFEKLASQFFPYWPLT